MIEASCNGNGCSTPIYWDVEASCNGNGCCVIVPFDASCNGNGCMILMDEKAATALNPTTELSSEVEVDFSFFQQLLG